jgi:hypothetical protein
MGLHNRMQVNDLEVVSRPCTDDRITLPHLTFRTKRNACCVEMHLERTKIHLKTFRNYSGLWICCFYTAGVFPCPSKSYFSGTGRRATMIISRFESSDLIIESRFPGLKYTGNSHLLPKEFVRCVWSDMPNTGAIGAPSGRHSCPSGQNHHGYDVIQLTYLFIPPPVARFHL